MSLGGRLQATAGTPWRPVSGSALGGVALLALVCAWMAHTGERWVHLLDGANLLFHEAGHPFFGLLFGDNFTVYGGTLGQLVFPVVAAVSFWLRREAASFAVALVWFSENLWNIARYAADARAQALPLVGGGEHDWTEILSRWGLLEHDGGVASVIRFAGWLGVIATLTWLVHRWQDAR
jgi:hypothetical protein